jgi:hypothetical protein
LGISGVWKHHIFPPAPGFPEDPDIKHEPAVLNCIIMIVALNNIWAISGMSVEIKIVFSRWLLYDVHR